jgi:hypothetical protein
MKTTRPPHESRYVTAARIAYQLAQASMPRYAHPKSPHRFTQPQVVACVLLTFYVDLSYRDWIKGAYAVGLGSRLVLAWASGPGSQPDFGYLRPLKRQARADLVAAARLDALYGQRWLIETVNSLIKRKFGDTIRSRSRRLQLREPIVKALVYNIHL